MSESASPSTWTRDDGCPPQAITSGASGEGGVAENLQRTLADAHEAMSDLSDDTEALKHNFLFRDFFSKRGFSVENKLRLDETMTELLNLPRNGPLMVGGFAGEGTASQQYLLGRRRAVSVRLYMWVSFPWARNRSTRGVLGTSKRVWALWLSTSRQVSRLGA
jgi:hypothetical protein